VRASGVSILFTARRQAASVGGWVDVRICACVLLLSVSLVVGCCGFEMHKRPVKSPVGVGLLA
jgi:hypothetical protein